MRSSRVFDIRFCLPSVNRYSWRTDEDSCQFGRWSLLTCKRLRRVVSETKPAKQILVDHNPVLDSWILSGTSSRWHSPQCPGALFFWKNAERPLKFKTETLPAPGVPRPGFRGGDFPWLAGLPGGLRSDPPLLRAMPFQISFPLPRTPTPASSSAIAIGQALTFLDEDNENAPSRAKTDACVPAFSQSICACREQELLLLQFPRHPCRGSLFAG
jgi:hypothetical protein